MRKWVKWVAWIFALLLLLLVGAFLLRETIMKKVIERSLRANTGMIASIGALEASLKSHHLTIQNLTLRNPPEFGGTTFVSMPELHVDYDPQALKRKKLHLHLVRFNLGEFNIVRNEAGQTNVVMVIEKLSLRDGGPLEFTGIDTLNLTIGTFRYVDMARPKASQELNLLLKNEVAHNVKSYADLQRMVLRIAIRHGALYLSNLSRGTATEITKNPGRALETEMRKARKADTPVRP